MKKQKAIGYLKKSIKVIFICLSILYLLWVLLWAGMFRHAGLKAPVYMFGSVLVKADEFVKLSIQDSGNNQIVISGYCGGNVTYPYKLDKKIKDQTMFIGVYIRCPFVLPWLWNTVGKNRDRSPRYFEYTVDVPEQVKSMKWMDSEISIWERK